MDESKMPIRINMFGGFSMTVGDLQIKDSTARSHQLWNFLEYLVAFRRKTVSQDELIRALWEEESIENPSGALKNLAYRVRSMFVQHGIPFAKKIIIFREGSYQWNNALDCVVDTEEFEGHHQQAADAQRPVEWRIDRYIQAIDLYKGDFLPASNYRRWAVPVSGYYRSAYFKCVYEVLKLLVEQERYREVEIICNKALIIDQFEENTHKYLLLSYIRQGKQSKAIEHYKSVNELFMRELGTGPSAALRGLYRQVTRSQQSAEIDINIIQQDLQEDIRSDGAFYCEYEVFKNIYQVQARDGQPHFVCLLTLSDARGGAIDPQDRKKAMDALFKVIQLHTRKKDIFARYSSNQYVLLMPTSSAAKCETVISHIAESYKRDHKVGSIEVSPSVQIAGQK